ncbi:hypothetical protein HYFRA_00005544 [Hymenoscyphus fraxineus]|uniref:Transcription initiation factor IIF subunit alpha n=1 Tax=Hymenoscyphus fraxineus TaxID=746836 RepID=A0A9N9PQR7_9HELO|nr:hypothetical protein HYFRA_00005544 [Hymenoscyphus fraxineus]
MNDTIMNDTNINDSPSAASNGQTPTPNSGGAPRYTRKLKAADPLRPRKKIVRAPNIPKGAAPIRVVKRPAAAPARGLYPVNGVAPSTNGAAPAQKTHDGWTHAPKGRVVDFPLYTTKKALREGLRYHVIRFSSKTDVNPANPEEFIRPVTLHRRDPKQPPPGQVGKEEIVDEQPMDSKEREKQEILKAEKERKRAEDQAQIAPSRNHPAQKKNQAFKGEKTSQVFRLDKNEEEKKASDLRYEEALPWHLEDAEGKNTWVGNYEAALSDTNAMLVIDGSRFLMVPMEKWYKFTAKNKFRAFTIEEAEAQLSKKTKEARWVMQEGEKKIKAPPMTNMYTVKAESRTARNANKSELAEMDDLDFAEGDLFQDDDEQATVEPDNDEDTKEAQSKIKREQLNANYFNQADEAQVEELEQKERDEDEAKKRAGKEVKKALTKREKNYLYDSDSDHPYSDSSEDDTSDEEKQKEIDKRKDEEAKSKLKDKEKEKDKATASKLPSGASSKGTNTPSGRPKHTDALKGKSKNNLKRSGSPNLSESSGNESARKKHKKKHSSQPSGASTPIFGSRPSPALHHNPSPVSEIQSSTPKPGSPMSDGEATGGEDGSKKRKIKLRLGSTPSGSRAGSPEARPTGTSSRAGSPMAASAAGSPAGAIQSHEIIAALPPQGISIVELMKLFKNRVGDKEGQTNKKAFIALVKENCSYGDNKLLRPKVQ